MVSARGDKALNPHVHSLTCEPLLAPYHLQSCVSRSPGLMLGVRPKQLCNLWGDSKPLCASSFLAVLQRRPWCLFLKCFPQLSGGGKAWQEAHKTTQQQENTPF